MDIIAKNIIEALKPLLGPLTPLLILRELKDLHTDSLIDANDDQKKMVLEKLMTNIINPVVSPQKRSIMRSLLLSCLKFSSSTLDSENKLAHLNYDSGD